MAFEATYLTGRLVTPTSNGGRKDHDWALLHPSTVANDGKVKVVTHAIQKE
jgi:hypothetical protein